MSLYIIFKCYINLNLFQYRCKANNLRNTLNVHPASGIQMWEDTFDKMVKAMGLNSSVRIMHTPPTCRNTLT